MRPNRNRKRKESTSRLLHMPGNFVALGGVFAIALGIYLYLCLHPSIAVFPLRHILFDGNVHLSDDELHGLAKLGPTEDLATISGKDLSAKFLKSPWIRSVSVMKQFPDTLTVAVTEAEPFALLEMNERLFLVDDQGKILEELKGDSVPFLPVITGDPFERKEGFREALNLVGVINSRDLSSRWDYIWIAARKPQDITVTFDETVVKMGSGGYEEKLERFVHLEEDIRKMGIPTDYIDLRFEGKAIVKPIVEKIEE